MTTSLPEQRTAILAGFCDTGDNAKGCVQFARPIQPPPSTRVPSGA